MPQRYEDVTVRFLNENERLLPAQSTQMPLVIEAKHQKDLVFLQTFLKNHSQKLHEDLAQYGAILLRGFQIDSELAFEETILSIQGFKGISEAFMSEEGRIHVDPLKYVLFTNAVYKTGGTLYLGGFHSENYYSADVPSYISFFCVTPSKLGGETGLINMTGVYDQLSPALQEKLEKQTCFAKQWPLEEIKSRYQISETKIHKICSEFGLKIYGEGKNQFILLFKPNVFVHPKTKRKAFQVNLFEIPRVNHVMRQVFGKEYVGKQWFWHRFVWKLPPKFFKLIETIFVMFASFFHSPKESLTLFKFKCKMAWLLFQNQSKIGKLHRLNDCFTDEEVEELVLLLRKHYASCLWQKGDIMIVDNKQVAHAGMPGAGRRLVRAMICNPLEMTYLPHDPGLLQCQEKNQETIGYQMTHPSHQRLCEERSDEAIEWL